MLSNNYFYFDNSELNKILALSSENLCDDNEFSFANRQILIFDAFYEYITQHRCLVLSGFVNFRLKNYRTLLEELVDFSVNEYIIEREYLEFVSLLRLYINSQSASKKTVHLISLEHDTFLLDENMQLINVDKNALNAKYLSMFLSLQMIIF